MKKQEEKSSLCDNKIQEKNNLWGINFEKIIIFIVYYINSRQYGDKLYV
jgi:hypothetical protein